MAATIDFTKGPPNPILSFIRFFEGTCRELREALNAEGDSVEAFIPFEYDATILDVQYIVGRGYENILKYMIDTGRHEKFKAMLILDSSPKNGKTSIMALEAGLYKLAEEPDMYSVAYHNGDVLLKAAIEAGICQDCKAMISLPIREEYDKTLVVLFEKEFLKIEGTVGRLHAEALEGNCTLLCEAICKHLGFY